MGCQMPVSGNSWGSAVSMLAPFRAGTYAYTDEVGKGSRHELLAAVITNKMLPLHQFNVHF